MSQAKPLLETVKLSKVYRFGPGKVRGSSLLLLKACQLAGWDGGLNGPISALRTYAQQAYLYGLYLAGRGAPAFPPWSKIARHLRRNNRRDNHWRVAWDVFDADGLIRAARKLGVELHRPHAGEPWHVEPVGRFDARAVYRKARRRYA